MTARQLIADMPEDAVVLCGGDGGHAWIGGLEPQRNDSGLPEEVILLPDLRE